MAKAALDAGLVDQLGDRRAVRSAARRSSAARTSDGPGGYKQIKLRRLHRRHGRPESARARSASSPSPAMIVDGKARRGTAGGDTHRQADRGRHPRQGHQGAGRAGRQPGRLGARVRAHPPGAARGQGEEHPGRGVDGQRRRIGRLLGRDPGRLHLRRAVDHHRVDRRVRRPAELPGHAAEARHRRRRRQDDAAVGRARPAQGPSPEAEPADPDRRRSDLPPLPRHRRRSRATRRRPRSTGSPRAACGTAAPRTSSGWSTASAAWTKRSPRRPQLAKLGDERGVRYLEPPPSFRDQLLGTLAARGNDDDATAQPDAFAMLSPAAAAAACARHRRRAPILAGPSIQARCLECPAGAPAPALRQSDVSLARLC